MVDKNKPETIIVEKEVTEQSQTVAEQCQSTENVSTKEEVTITQKPIEKVVTEQSQSSENLQTKEEKFIETKAEETKAEEVSISKIPSSKVAYTNEEKFAEMSRKNPALKTLKQQLSLEFF